MTGNMLQQIEITNFKAIGETVTIPIRPITMLLGANSSGKSSILQCLMMLAQSLSVTNFNDGTLLPKGDLVDLGTSKNFLYQHNLEKEICIKFTFALPENPSNFFQKNIKNALGSAIRIDSFTKDAHILFSSLKGYKRIGIAYTIRDAKVSKIDLFIGNATDPVFSHISHGLGKELFINKDIYIINDRKYYEDHEYWKSYAEALEEVDRDYLINKVTDSLDYWRDTFDQNDASEEDEEKGTTITEFRYRIEEIILPSLQRKGSFTGETYLQSEITAVEAINFFKVLHAGGFGLEFQRFEGILPFDVNYNNADRLISKALSSSQPFRWIGMSPGLFIGLLSEHIKEFLIGLNSIDSLREPPKRYYLLNDNDQTGIITLSNDPKLLDKVNKEFEYLQTGYQLEIEKLSNDAFDVEEVFVLQFIDKKTGCKASIKNVGFGFSQILPIVVNSSTWFYGERTLVIEQPELHLHPAMQAELGDLFIRNCTAAYEKDVPQKFILETHSEHLILRLLRRVRETTNGELPDNVPPIKADDIAVLYVQPGAKGAKVTHIPVTDDGDFVTDWPDGFFEERDQELFG